MYRFLRRTLHIPFHSGESALDTSLRKIFAAIQRHDMDDILVDIFKPAVQEEIADYTKDIDEKQPLAVKQWTGQMWLLIIVKTAQVSSWTLSSTIRVPGMSLQSIM